MSLDKNDKKIVKDFNAKWEYRLDSEQYGMADAWKIIYVENAYGKYVGDCEDYALSVLYRLCGESHLKMWWMLITHQAGICLVGPSKWKVSHAVLRYKGEWVDNWTKKLGPKSEIEKNHTFHAVFGLGFAYMTAIKMLKSKVVRQMEKQNELR
jgi:hypothetical protein|tara:strand:- start:6285 stop:6743 length:459 start_codon:yes stop_codon:yes gene_type:complete